MVIVHLIHSFSARMKSADIIEPFLKNLRVEELGGKFLIIVKKAMVEPFLTAVSGTGGFHKQFQLTFTLPCSCLTWVCCTPLITSSPSW